MISYLDFEKPVAALEERIAQLRSVNALHDVDVASEIGRLESKSAELLASTYASLTPWQKTQVARHPDRPHFKHYVAGLFDDWMPLAGDRNFGDDQAILGGLARFRGRRVMVIGHEKGNDTQSRIRHNFGMGKPEGYRKAIRLMELAGRFGLPVVTLVDTSGAFPGIEAEERGQAEAIARSTEQCLALGVPMVAAIVGEGGSGGAIALAAIAQDLVKVEAAAFCAPMWGLKSKFFGMSYLVWAMRATGRSGDYAIQPGPPEKFGTNIVTHDKRRWELQRDLVDADAAGGKGTVGIPAPASVPQFLVQVRAQRNGLDLVAAPYRGSAPMMADMLGNQIPAGVGSVPDFIENHKAGKLRIVAVMGTQRQPQLPDVPTFTELGIKGFEDVPYYGLFAPAGTPRAALDRLGSALQKTLAQPDVRDRLTAMGLSVGYTAGDALAARETAYRQAWARIIKDSGYQPQ